MILRSECFTSAATYAISFHPPKVNNTRMSATLTGQASNSVALAEPSVPKKATPTMARSPNALTIVNKFWVHFP